MRMWELLPDRHDPEVLSLHPAKATQPEKVPLRLTLRALHNLKLLRLAQRLERLRREEFLAAMYGNAEQDEDEIAIEKARLDLVRKALDVEGKALEVDRKKAVIKPPANR